MLVMVLIGDVFIGEKRVKVFGILEVYNGVGKVVVLIIGVLVVFVVWYVVFFVYFLVVGVVLVGIVLYVREGKIGLDLVFV